MDTQWRHKSKISEKLGLSGRQNLLRPYLKIWEWEWIFGRAVKAFSSLGVRSPWENPIGTTVFPIKKRIVSEETICRNTVLYKLVTYEPGNQFWLNFSHPIVKSIYRSNGKIYSHLDFAISNFVIIEEVASGWLDALMVIKKFPPFMGDSNFGVS